MFKKKEESKEIRIACDSCGKVFDSALKSCPGCKQGRRLSSVSDSDPAAPEDPSTLLTSTPASDYFPELAPVSRRVAAAFIDHVLVLFISVLFSTLLSTTFLDYIMSPGAVAERVNQLPAIFNIPALTLGMFLLPAAFLAVLVFPLLYFACSESSSWQATLGKRICGLRVVGLNSARINFKQSFGKGLLQGIILYFIGVLASISTALFAALLSLGRLSCFAFIGIEALLLAALFCLPLFRARTQSALDKLSGRILVKADNFDEAKWADRISSRKEGGKSFYMTILAFLYWLIFGISFMVIVALSFFAELPSMAWRLAILFVPLVLVWIWEKTKDLRKWSVLRDALALLALLFIVPGVLWSATYDVIFMNSALAAVPLIEKAAKLDPDLENNESRRALEKAKKICPDIHVAYVLFGGIADCLGRPAEAASLKRLQQLLSADSLGAFLSRGEIFERENKFDKALSNYREALSTLPSGKQSLRVEGLSRGEIYSIVEVQVKISRAMMRLGKNSDANKILTELIDFYPEGLTADFCPSKKSELYALRAETWRALKKTGLADSDEKRSQDLKASEQKKEENNFGPHNGKK
ncbi:MAG: RDD family protein [Candidatus Obscuribacterales bacterium]|nr:RDD family protein [Candidatus Obscuribacterales bacterium]